MLLNFLLSFSKKTLLIQGANAEECDATGAATGTKAGNKKIIMPDRPCCGKHKQLKFFCNGRLFYLLRTNIFP